MVTRSSLSTLFVSLLAVPLFAACADDAAPPGAGNGPASAEEGAPGDEVTVASDCPADMDVDDDGTCVGTMAAEPEMLENDALPEGLHAPVVVADTTPTVASSDVTFGVVARKGSFRSTTRSILRGTINVRKSDWGWSDSNDRVFRSFRNRTQQSPELATYETGRGGYLSSGQSPGTELYLSDPSCTIKPACEHRVDPDHDPTYVYYKQVGKMPADYLQKIDASGNCALRFELKSVRAAGTNSWTNTFSLYNFTQKKFALLRTHTFTAKQADCSIAESVDPLLDPTLGACGAALAGVDDYLPSAHPSLVPEQYRAKSKLMFKSFLLIDNANTPKLLTSANTSFTSPSANWNMLPRTNNSNFTAQHK